jgi:hypothetical protein
VILTGSSCSKAVPEFDEGGGAKTGLNCGNGKDEDNAKDYSLGGESPFLLIGRFFV